MRPNSASVWGFGPVRLVDAAGNELVWRRCGGRLVGVAHSAATGEHKEKEMKLFWGAAGETFYRTYGAGLASTCCRHSAFAVAGPSPATETAATAMAAPWLSSVIYVAFQSQQLIGASSWIKSGIRSI